jgi:hypothetical protein
MIPYVDRPMNPTERSSTMNPVVPNILEGDMDNDGISNLDEFRYPFGTLDPTDPDSDQDGMPDGWEVAMGRPLWNASAENGSGYTNGTITRILDPLGSSGQCLVDPDVDGVNYSMKWTDLNGNKYPDSGEFHITESDFNNDGVIDPFYENESYSNLEEYWYGRDCDADGVNENTTYPFDNDTDHDGMLDGYEVYYSDSDGDALPNGWELLYGLNPLDPMNENGSSADPDNLQEYRNHTNPKDPKSTPAAGRGFGTMLDQDNPEYGAYMMAKDLEVRLLLSPCQRNIELLRDIRFWLRNW